MTEQNSNRREFERLKLTFDAEIDAEDLEGKAFREQVVLRNISGGGVGFESRMGGRYFCGQLISVSISLPATGGARSTMQGKARVVRIGAEEGDKALIGVATLSPLRFERDYEQGSSQ